MAPRIVTVWLSQYDRWSYTFSIGSGQVQFCVLELELLLEPAALLELLLDLVLLEEPDVLLLSEEQP
jgi:hypothetical protein